MIKEEAAKAETLSKELKNKRLKAQTKQWTSVEGQLLKDFGAIATAFGIEEAQEEKKKTKELERIQRIQATQLKKWKAEESRIWAQFMAYDTSLLQNPVVFQEDTAGSYLTPKAPRKAPKSPQKQLSYATINLDLSLRTPSKPSFPTKNQSKKMSRKAVKKVQKEWMEGLSSDEEPVAPATISRTGRRIKKRVVWEPELERKGGRCGLRGNRGT